MPERRKAQQLRVLAARGLPAPAGQAAGGGADRLAGHYRAIVLCATSLAGAGLG